MRKYWLRFMSPDAGEAGSAGGGASSATSGAADAGTAAGGAAAGGSSAGAGGAAAGSDGKVAGSDGKAADQTAADAAAATAAATAAAAAADEPAKPVVPEKYELKLPDGSVLDAGVQERLSEVAKKMGLTNEGAQQTLDFVNTEVASQIAAIEAAHTPGTGAEWLKTQDAWIAQSLADPFVGGSKEALERSVALGKRVATSFGSPGFVGFLETTGLGSHPEVIAFMKRVGDAMSEGSLVTPGAASGAALTEQDKLYALYPTMRPKQ